MAKLLPALALLAVIVPSSAFGQATRTWVSGVGDDVNPFTTLNAKPREVFTGRLRMRSGGKLRAKVRGENSLVWSQRG